MCATGSARNTTDPLTPTAYSDHVSDQVEDAADRLEPHVVAAVVDVFVYVVVLNLFVGYLPRVLSETFTLSLLTAVLLKGVLEVVVAAKNRVKARFREASTPIGKVVAAPRGVVPGRTCADHHGPKALVRVPRRR